MNLRNYIKDKIFNILMYIFVLTLILILLYTFQINATLIVLIIILYLMLIIPYIFDYIKRKTFYNYVDSLLNKLDKKCLIHEIIDKGNFTESEILMRYLYEIDKDYNDELSNYKYSQRELREYLELWCHEIKTPIATSKLIIGNMKNSKLNDIDEEIEKIDYYVEQVLYYARSENVEEDYLINNICINNIINDVIKRNKKDLIGKKIKAITFNENIYVKSDYKWILYIINQIVINSIKYSKKTEPKIIFDYVKNKENIILTIEDNGIGIKNEDIDRVFNKGFTGINGRDNVKSTGMGLYLCKKLCDKLGHSIYIDSKDNDYTKVSIIFPNNSMTN